ncbi:MAG: hypothetical protein QMC98_02240 [Candidatus Thermoplasmatota archaeon]|nr:hypothetical protein [Candidatus Thermoplasmatota archaeon]
MIEYPYLLIRGKHFPIIPVTLINKGIEKEFFALVDSGSSVSIFKFEVARQLDNKVEIRVEDYKFTSKIAFSEEYTASLNILGRDNFFQSFLDYFQ